MVDAHQACPYRLAGNDCLAQGVLFAAGVRPRRRWGVLMMRGGTRGTEALLKTDPFAIHGARPCMRFTVRAETDGGGTGGAGGMTVALIDAMAPATSIRFLMRWQAAGAQGVMP